LDKYNHAPIKEFFPYLDSSLFEFCSFEKSGGNKEYEKTIASSSMIIKERSSGGDSLDIDKVVSSSKPPKR